MFPRFRAIVYNVVVRTPDLQSDCTQFELYARAHLTHYISPFWALSTNCSVAWVVDSEVKAMLYATLAVS